MNVKASFRAAEKTLTYVDANDFDAIIQQVYAKPYNVIAVAEQHNGSYLWVEADGSDNIQFYIDEAFAKWDEYTNPPGDGKYRRERDYMPSPWLLFADMANKGIIPENLSVNVHIYW